MARKSQKMLKGVVYVYKWEIAAILKEYCMYQSVAYGYKRNMCLLVRNITYVYK